MKRHLELLSLFFLNCCNNLGHFFEALSFYDLKTIKRTSLTKMKVLCVSAMQLVNITISIYIQKYNIQAEHYGQRYNLSHALTDRGRGLLCSHLTWVCEAQKHNLLFWFASPVYCLTNFYKF